MMFSASTRSPPTCLTISARILIVVTTLTVFPVAAAVGSVAAVATGAAVAADAAIGAGADAAACAASCDNVVPAAHGRMCDSYDSLLSVMTAASVPDDPLALLRQMIVSLTPDKAVLMWLYWNNRSS